MHHELSCRIYFSLVATWLKHYLAFRQPQRTWRTPPKHPGEVPGKAGIKEDPNTRLLVERRALWTVFIFYCRISVVEGMWALESVPGLRDDLGHYSEHFGARLGFLSGEMEPAICLPRSILWIYEILSIKYPAHTRHIADAPKTEAIILLSGEGNGIPLQYSCLENPMDRGVWRATVHGVTKSWTQLSD